MFKRLFIRLFVIILVIISYSTFPITTVAEETIVRIGLYENKPRMFTNEQGNPDGFFIKILEYIAEQESWKIQYIRGTRVQCLDRLEQGNIDLIPDVSYTDERARRYDFSDEDVYTNWSIIYKAPDSPINNIVDLEGTSIAFVKGTVASTEFKSLIEQFGISCSFINVNNHDKVFELVSKKNVDAGMVDRLFGLSRESKYSVVKTDIICCPMKLHFATAKNKGVHLLGAVDRHLKILKQDKNSLYYEQLYLWFEGVKRVEYPRWVMIFLKIAGMIFFITVAGMIISVIMVRIRTRGLKQEIERHRETAEKLHRSEKLLNETQHLTRVGGWEYDVRTKEMVWTDEVYHIHEIPVDPFIDHIPISLKCYGMEGSQKILDAFRRAAKMFKSYDFELPFTTVQGNQLWVRTIGRPVCEDGKVMRIVGNIMDITAQKEVEEEIRRTNRVLTLLSKCNESLIRASDEQELLNNICSNIVGIGGYRLSWVGYKKSGNEKRVEPVAQAGVEEGYLKRAKITWDDTEWGRGPTGTAIRTGVPSVCRNILDDPSFIPWRDLATERGYASSIAIPLKRYNDVFGALNIFATQPEAFNSKENELLVELADDLAYGVSALRTRVEHKHMEDAFRESKERLELVLKGAELGTWDWDVPSGDIVFNERWAEMLEYTLDEIEPNITSWEKLLHPEDIPMARKVLDDHLDGKTSVYQIEQRLRTKSGNWKWILDTGTVLVRDRQNNPIRVAGTHQDITDRKLAELALLESEERFRRALENIPDVVVIYDTDLRIRYINSATHRITGRIPSDLIGKRDNDILPPDVYNTYLPTLRETLNTRKICSVDTDITFPERGILNLRITCVPLVDDKGNVREILGITHDFTENKRFEAIIKESRRRLRAILDNIPDRAWLKDREYRFIAVNEALAKACNLSPRDLIGKSDMDIWPQEIAEKHHADDREVVETGKRKVVEELISGEDGQVIWLETITTPICNRSGEVIGTASIARNITDRKLAEKQRIEYSKKLEQEVEVRTRELNKALQATEEARDKIDGILKSVADGLIVTDHCNRVILINRAAEDLLGVRFSEVINRTINYAVRDDTLRERIMQTLEKRAPGYEFDFELPGNENHSRVMRAKTSIITDKEGVQTGIITIIHDVTYEREIDRMKTEFLSTAAHELRSPLTSIQGFSEILINRDNLTNEQRSRFLSYINSQATNLGAIINDLLDISRIESGKGFALRKVPSDIVKIVKKIASYFESVSEIHSFKLLFPPPHEKIMIDPDKIEQVMSNIFSNAVKYSPEGGVIKVVGKVNGDYYHMSVEDEGIGMTPDEVEHIYDKFYRADNSTTAVSGTGLGMSIVKYILEAHGGTVWVESEIGKGTKVSMSIPLKDGDNV